MVVGCKKKYDEYIYRYMDIVFIYILLLEYIDKSNLCKGEWREGVMVLCFNFGFCDVFVEQGIVMVSVGQ